jgi:hypothetical protein
MFLQAQAMIVLVKHDADLPSYEAVFMPAQASADSQTVRVRMRRLGGLRWLRSRLLVLSGAYAGR